MNIGIRADERPRLSSDDDDACSAKIAAYTATTLVMSATPKVTRPAVASAGFAAFHVSRPRARHERPASARRTPAGNEYTRSPSAFDATDTPSTPASADASCVSPYRAASRSTPPAAATSDAVSRTTSDRPPTSSFARSTAEMIAAGGRASSSRVGGGARRAAAIAARGSN